MSRKTTYYVCSICGRRLRETSPGLNTCRKCKGDLIKAKKCFQRLKIDTQGLTDRELVEKFRHWKKQNHKAQKGQRYCRVCGRPLKHNYYVCRSCMHSWGGEHRVDGDWVYY